MPRQKHSPAAFAGGNSRPPGPPHPHLSPGPGGPVDQFFPGNRGPPLGPPGPGQQGPPPHLNSGPPPPHLSTGQQGPPPHLNSGQPGHPPPHLNSDGSPFSHGPGMPPPVSQPQFNHDFLDDLIQPVTAGMDNDPGPGMGPSPGMGGPSPGMGPSPGLGPSPNHFFDNHSPFPPNSGPPTSMVPHSMGMPANHMGGPPLPSMPGPMGPPGTGKIYPPNQSMVFNPSNPNAPPIYPCGVCHKEVHDNDQAILCESGCNFWFHRACTGLSEAAFVMLKEEVYAEWVCDKCLNTKTIPVVKLKP